jgi:hypothetical protein
MAPALNHPSGVTFIDEHRAVNTDAAEYYGGQEQFSRGRTYSAVSNHLFHIIPNSKPHVCILVFRPRLQPQASTRISG